ncbi:MAG: O-antigen ligase family protein, partial [Planctomycetes bacterium]|nr:O-antigen ligase family protein [Planctomycetota bacterium]
LIVQLIQTPKDVRDFIWANVIFNLWTLKSVVVISLRGGDADRANVSAAQGGGANYLAMVFCMGLPILYFGFLHGRKLEKRLAMIIAPLTLFAIVGTGSRGGFLTLLCVVAFLAVRSRRIFAGFGTVLAMGLLLFLVTPEEKWERYMTIFRGDEERGHAAQSRLDLWKAGLKMFRQSPVTGVGHDNFSLLSARYVGYFAGDTPVAYDPALDGQKGFTGFVCHNTFIQSLAEGGLIGSIPFFLLFIMYFVNCYRARRVPLLPDSKREIWILSQVLEGTMWAFIVSSIFGSHFKIDFLWWYFGASTALYLTARRLQVIEAQITEEAQPPPAEARTWGLSNVPVRS